MTNLCTGLGQAKIADEVSRWLRESLPGDWRSAVDAGDYRAVERIREKPERIAQWFDALGTAGLAAPTWPREYGGLELSEAEAGVVAEELGKYRAELPDSYYVTLALAGPTILSWGEARQKEQFLPPMAEGRHRWCQLFSEPGAGSDLASLSTSSVRRTDGSWVVNGQKVWSSFAHISDYGLLMARTDPTSPKHSGITYFLLDMRTDGVRTQPLRQMTGDAEFNEVFLTDVVIPDENRLGPVNQGWKVAISTLMRERSGISGRPTVGEGQVDQLLRRAVTTGAWDELVTRDRLMSAFVTERVLQMTTLRAHAKADSAEPGAAGSIRKLAHSDLEEEIGLLAAEIEPSGALAWTANAPDDEAYAAGRRLLALKTYSIAGGTSEIQRNVIGERVLGLEKEPDPERNLPFEQRRRT